MSIEGAPIFPPGHRLPSLRELDFSRRTYKLRELLDEPCTFAEYSSAMRDLSQANRVTRGFRPLLGLIETTVKRIGVGHEPLHVVDYGCGSGDLLRAVREWGSRRSVPFKLTGVDASAYAGRLARECDRLSGVGSGEIKWLTGDLFRVELEREADVALCSLVAHHLADESVVVLLRKCAEAKCGWMVVDLRRSQRAATLFSSMGALMGWHRFVKHDGVVSFARAFSLEEWQGLVTKAGVKADVLDIGLGRLAITGV